MSMRVEGGAWEEVKRTKHTKALVTGLKSKKKYDFKVTATNSVMISLGNMKETETELSPCLRLRSAYSTASCNRVSIFTG